MILIMHNVCRHGFKVPIRNKRTLVFDATAGHCASKPMYTGNVTRISVVPFTSVKYVDETPDMQARNRHEAQTLKKVTARDVQPGMKPKRVRKKKVKVAKTT